MATTHPTTDEPEGFTQRRTTAAATGITKPAGAKNSVFDVAKPTSAPKAQRGAPLDFTKITVHSNVPLPAANSRPGQVRQQLLALLNRMQPGDMIKLPKSRIPHARATAKAAGIPVALRTLGPDEIGIWRLADDQADES